MSFYQVSLMSFSYPKSNNIFNEVSFKLDKNERIGFFGPNGSGKTTMAKLMMGILKPTGGEILLEGKPVSKMGLARIGQRVGYVFQNPSKQLFAPTVWEQVAFGLSMGKEGALEGCKPDERVNYWLDFFELSDASWQFPHYLSRGQKQRLVLAQVLARGADFFFMDEPTVGIDRLRLKKLDQCLEAVKDSGRGYIIISHDMDFLRRHTERLIFFAGDGTVREL
ncbi:MAG: energy-coupling factor transport system ATP-binding protein [Tepidanaerobacteraceae bacterium]|nr:energy-coupling factor transport system ATP-binding protein [Tepidanaerobacteraceae bacterium]